MKGLTSGRRLSGLRFEMEETMEVEYELDRGPVDFFPLAALWLTLVTIEEAADCVWAVLTPFERI